MSAASRNDMVGLQKLQDSPVEQIGDDAVAGTRRRGVRKMVADLHARGCVLEDAAEAIGITVEHARVAAYQLGLRFKTDAQRRREHRKEIIRQGYADGLPMVEIAKLAGISVSMLARISTSMGVAHDRATISANRRGFTIPEHLKDDYRTLTKRGGYRSREAGIALGLLEA